MNLQKKKPFRSREYMKFLHERRDLVGESCAFCSEPWSQLHHFGSDGGQGMKPTDLKLVRLCKTCADKYEVKERTLWRMARFELLATFQGDALDNLEAWIKYGSGK